MVSVSSLGGLGNSFARRIRIRVRVRVRVRVKVRVRS